jgi:transposase
MNRALANSKEARRRQAWYLKQKDWSRRQIAEALGVREGAVSQWMRRACEGGLATLRHRSQPGAARRLSADQLARLPVLLHRGPATYGFQGQLWTSGRVAEVIRVEVGVVYHLTHVGRLLEPCTGAHENLPSAPTGATRRPLLAGATRPGSPSTGGTSSGADGALHR